jgi:hypothetical protein
VIALSTVAVGVLLAVAGVIASSLAARLTDLCMGSAMIVLAAYRMRSLQHKRRSAVGV